MEGLTRRLLHAVVVQQPHAGQQFAAEEQVGDTVEVVGQRMIIIGQVLIVAVAFDVLYRRYTGERL